MALSEIFKERTETIGIGKSKMTIIEILIGNYNYTSADVDEDSGIPHQKEWTTGATLENPFGLQLMSQELCIDRRGTGGATNIYVGGFVLVNDPDAESGEGLLRDDNYNVKNILSLYGTASDHIDGSVLGAPIYVKEDYSALAIQRLFTAPTLPLEVTSFLYGLSGSDSVDVTAKFTIKKVKMTKNAWLEKLAVRSYC